MADGDVLTIVAGHQAFAEPTGGVVTTYQRSLTLDHTEILALRDIPGPNPVELVPAPAAGELIVPHHVVFERVFPVLYTGGDQPYEGFYVALAGAQIMGLYNTDTAGGGSSVRAFFQGSGSEGRLTYLIHTPYSAYYSLGIALTGDDKAGAPLMLVAALDTAIGGGDAANQMRVTVDYSIVTVL